MRVRCVKRPGNNRKLTETLVGIAREHVGVTFTENVPGDLRSDLRFQDAFVLTDKGKVQSFLAFTGIDRSVYIMMFATRLSQRGKGYGSLLYAHFERYIARYGITSLRIQTVPPEVNENYRPTLAFYEKLGFRIVKRYTELWEHGALELEKLIG